VVVEKTDSVKDLFDDLIQALSSINSVVILIDEYDKPILDYVHDVLQANARREILRNFYLIIKAADQLVRFAFLTGVTKFAKTSIFSGLNNLRDISLSEKYATLLGYTHQELIDNFTPHLENQVSLLGNTVDAVVESLQSQYDGYRFAKNATLLFNPYSVLTSLTEHALGNYWFASGTPTFLINLIKQGDYDVNSVTHPVLNADDLGSFEPENIPLPALLFQTGYLTIAAYEPQTDNYTLAIPNREVYRGFMRQLANGLTMLPVDKSLEYAKRMFKKFLSVDIEGLGKVLQEFFNRMPYTVHVKSESQLQFVLYAIFALIGVAVDPEVTTSLGRADLVVSLPKLIYVIELKFNGSAQQALEQIQDKKYYEKYLSADKQITLVGINFDQKTKTVSLESSGI